MQDKQHADTKSATVESMPATPAATPTKPRGKVVTFFAKMYSPHGTLTCKEFIWLAVYLLTLGRLFDVLMLIPLEILAFKTPIRDANIVVKGIVVLYASGQHIMLFVYPLFNIHRKLLKITAFKELYYNIALGIIFISIYTHSIFLKTGTLLYYSSGYIICITMTLSVYSLAKNFCIKNKDATL